MKKMTPLAAIISSDGKEVKLDKLDLVTVNKSSGVSYPLRKVGR